MTLYRTLPLGLVIAVSAAPARHSSHAADALSAHSTELLVNIKEGDYTSKCWAAWQDYDSKRCWCYTGCALDCSQGGTPGVAGMSLHPAWCTADKHASHEDCSAPTLKLAKECPTDAAKGPGVSSIAFTGGYALPETAAQAMLWTFTNGKVFDDGHGRVYPGTAHGNSNQRFFAEYLTETVFKVHHARDPSKCVDWHPTDNSIYMGNCHEGENQKFYFVGSDGQALKKGDTQPYGQALKGDTQPYSWMNIATPDTRAEGQVLTVDGAYIRFKLPSTGATSKVSLK